MRISTVFQNLVTNINTIMTVELIRVFIMVTFTFLISLETADVCTILILQTQFTYSIYVHYECDVHTYIIMQILYFCDTYNE